MRTIGLIGGMSWESTLPYYRWINEAVRQRLGGLHSARLVLYSVDFQQIEQLQQAQDWGAAGALLAQAARALHAAGAQCVVLCTNTMHKVASDIEAAVPVPLLHIADATAAAVKAAGMGRIGLLGTRFTMEQDFYRRRLEQHGLEVVVPEAGCRQAVHRIIYEELCMGTIRAESRAVYQAAMQELVRQGAQGIVLGCTEIGLLVSAGEAPVPVFDTAFLHAQAAVDFALAVPG